ncbi:MAG: hypothetical protein QM820_47165 [Minicystis sp.]
MADPSTTDFSQYGPMGVVAGMAVTIATTIAGALKFHARISEAEEKLKKVAEDLRDLEDRFEAKLSSLDGRPDADSVRVIVASAMAPYQEKAIELREKLAEINGTLRSITGSDDRRAH